MSIDAESPLPSEQLGPHTPIKSRDSDTVLTMSSDGEGTSGGVGSSTLMSPSAAAANPASSFALPTTIDERDGYDERSSSLELRKDRTVYSRTVTITPPKPEPWWSPNKSTPKKKKKKTKGGESSSSSQEHKEPNSPNPFEMALSPFKDMIDAISQHGENKKEDAQAAAEAKENGRKRVERVTGKASDVAAEVIFVHGSCASSSQFDQLLSAIWERFYDDADGASTPNITKKIRCHLFDAVGCGSSPHDPKDWSAYGAAEQMKDIEEYVNIVSAFSTSATPIYFVGHSYGSSQIVRLLPLLPESISTRVEGIVLLSGALANGPSDVPKDDAPCVFCLPIKILKLIQPKMNDAFLDKAYHPTTNEALVAQGRMVCEGNDMAIVKAFYQQWSWATKDDASKVVTKAIVVHGAEDKLIIPDAGEHLNDMLPKSEFKSIPKASHQVMEERPGEVASILLSLIENK